MGQENSTVLDHDFAENSEDLNELLQEGKGILDSAINISGQLEKAINNISSIYNEIDGACKNSNLGEMMGRLRETLIKDIYQETIDRMETMVLKLLDHIPAYDSDLAGDMKELSETLNTVEGRIVDLKGLLLEGKADISYPEFTARLDSIKEKWNDTTDDMAKRIAEIEAEMLGAAVDAVRYSEDPVNLSTGNFVYDHEDMRVCGEIPLSFHRYYNSKDHTKGSMGRCFLHNYEVQLKEDENRNILIRMPDGQTNIFVKGKDGVYRGKNFGNKGEIRKKEGENMYVYTASEEICRVFDDQGKMMRQEDSTARGISFLYNSKGFLVKARTDTGSYLYYTYDDRGRLICVEDQAGRKTTLKYEKNKPAEIVLPEGDILGYVYGKNGRISEIIKGGTKVVRNIYDDKLRVLRQDFPDGASMVYSYDDMAHSVTLKERNGGKIVYFHDDAYKNTRVLYEDGSEERYEYNDRNLCTSITDRNGNTRKMAYDDRGNLTQTVDSAGRKVNLTYDKEGHLLKVSVNGREQLKNSYDVKGNLIRTECINGDNMGIAYDNAGRPIRLTRLNGATEEISYDERGNIVQVRNSAGNRTSYKYDILNRVTETEDANGNKTFYTYDSENRISKIVNAAGDARIYTYNENGKITGVQDFDGYCINASYNCLNLVEQLTDKDGNTTVYTYDAMWNITSALLPDGTMKEYHYNKDNRLSQICLPNGNSIYYVYDAGGRCISEKDADGNLITYAYDTKNRLTQMTDANGGMTRYEYDEDGNLAKVTDALGYVWNYTYDMEGRCTSETDPLLNTTSYVYDRMGHIVRVCHPGGGSTKFDYGTDGRLKDVLYPDGSGERYTYDGNGNLLCREERGGAVFTMKYDCLNRLTEMRNPQGGVCRYAYDAAGNVTQYTDELGNVTRYKWSPGGKLLAVTDAGENSTFYKYDVMGNLTEVRRTECGSGETQLTSYEWDALGNLSAMTDPLGNTERYICDWAGRLLEKTDRDGYQTVFGYDKAGNLTEIKYADGRSVKLSYNALNQLYEMKDWLGKTQIRLDALGKPMSVTGPDGKTVKYEWGAMGERRALIYPDGKCAEYHYNDKMQMTELVFGTKNIIYKYDEVGRILEKQLPGDARTKYVYGEKGELTKLVHCAHDDVAVFHYGYDEMGNRIRVLKERTKLPEDTGEFQYTYDPMRRLTEVKKDGQRLRRYVYDAFGNRTEKEDYANGGSSVIRYTYNRNNQLISEVSGKGKRNYVYDTRGNLNQIIENGRVLSQYTFDTAKRMRQAVDYTGQTACVAEFIYNGLGQRVRQEEYQIDLEELSERSLDRMRVDNHRKENAVQTICYTLDLIRSYRNLIEQDILARETKQTRNFYWDENVVAVEEAGKHGFYMQDVLGSPVELLNESGRSIESYAFDEFGMPLNAELAVSDKQPFGFAGYQMDLSGGFYYAQARRYDPSCGRFISEDEIKGYAAALETLNAYGYCWNRPLDLVDLDGRFPTIAIGAIVGGLISGGVELYSQVKKNGWKKVDVLKVIVKTGEGAASGALMGSGVGIPGAVAGNAAISATSSVVSDSIDRCRGIDVSNGKMIQNAFNNGAIGAVAGVFGGAGAKAPVKYVSKTVENVTYNMVKTTIRSMKPLNDAVVKAMIVGTGKMLLTSIVLNKEGETLLDIMEKGEQSVLDIIETLTQSNKERCSMA